MSPVGAIFVPFPPRTGTKMLHPRPPPPPIVERVLRILTAHDQKSFDGEANSQLSFYDVYSRLTKV